MNMAIYKPKKPRERADGIPDRRFKNLAREDYEKALRRMQGKIETLRFMIWELEEDYEKAVLANYRLVLWIKGQGLTVPATTDLSKKYNADHLKTRRNGPRLV